MSEQAHMRASGNREQLAMRQFGGEVFGVRERHSLIGCAVDYQGKDVDFVERIVEVNSRLGDVVAHSGQTIGYAISNAGQIGAK